MKNIRTERRTLSAGSALDSAFMGGADFVQWHGNYPMLAKTVELRAMGEELCRRHGR